MTDEQVDDVTELETFGVVVVVDADLRIAHISAHCGVILGVDRDRLIGASLAEILGETDLALLREALEAGVEAVGWRRVELVNGGAMKLHAFAPGEGLVGLDLLPLPVDAPGPGAQALERVAVWSGRLLRCDSSAELLDVTATIVRELTEFNGAWVSRRDRGGNSVLVAADVLGAPKSIGHSVQPGDTMPGQPRFRGRPIPFFVADLAADATVLYPSQPDDFELAGSLLLRPFPRFLGRMVEIGVRAMASVPIVVQGEMWGRVLAFHPAALRVPAATQVELGLLGVATGARLHELLSLERAVERDELASSANRVVKAIAGTDDLLDGLVRDPDALRGVGAATVAVASIAGRTASVGTSDQAVVDQLLEVARRALQASDDATTFSTTLDGPDPLDAERAAGYLAVRLDPSADDIVVWARGEWERNVTWVAPQVVDQAERSDLFEGLTQRLERRGGSCSPWTDAQQQQASELREAIGEVLIARYTQVQSLNAELTRSNEEYDAFAHAAAHDLKAPLRGIRQNAEFFLEDVGELEPPLVAQLQTVIDLAGRMNSMLDDLLAYAEVGNASWELRTNDLSEAVAEVVQLLGPREPEPTIVVDGSFPADPVALRQLLLNLIGNAFKYAGGRPTVTIGVTTLGEVDGPLPAAVADAAPDTPVLTVTDAGIGIAPAHHERIFGLFKQLDRASDGSGAGLAVCRLICRRHGGDIWLKSTPGEGTTFYAVTGA